MALIKCPECGREISDKAEKCIHCGYPIQEIINDKKNEYAKSLLAKYDESQSREMIKDFSNAFNVDLKNAKEYLDNIKNESFPKCPFCGKPVKNEHGYCYLCNKYIDKKETTTQKQFNGVYRYSLFGKKEEVYCPRCGSDDCSVQKEQRVIEGKKKTTYSVNLNPFKPFTLLNKNEKVIKNDKVVELDGFICNKCGKVF